MWVRDFQSATSANTARYAAFFREMLARGIYPPPSQFEAWFLSAAHTIADVDRTVAAAKESLEITKHAYDLGTGTLLDSLDAEQSYRMIESAYRAALARTAIAAQNIQFITGEVQP